MVARRISAFNRRGSWQMVFRPLDAPGAAAQVWFVWHWSP